MTESIPLELIELGAFNSRVRYPASSVDRLVRSLSSSGQLTPVRVRQSSRREGKYELIYGHRRVLAARQLGWKTIRAEIVETTDEQTLCESLVENYERQDLSSYEKALCFERMNTEFNRTYEEIGHLVGLSKQQVCSYIGMVRLFEPSELASNIELIEAVHELTEHHSRILSRVEDRETRMDLAIMTVRRQLTVKELTNILSHLRAWFPKEETSVLSAEDDPSGRLESTESNLDEKEIKRIIKEEFGLGRRGDFEKFRDLHVLEDAFSAFFSLPPHDRYQGVNAIERDREWFYRVSSKSDTKIRDVNIELLGESAVATLRVDYETTGSNRIIRRAVRGTLIFVRRDGLWKIFHEHWSEI